MSAPFRLPGIPGSLRADSFSSAILTALAEAAAPQAHSDFADIGTAAVHLVGAIIRIS
jgi:NAD(P)H-dependent FMN reductase